MAVSIVTDKSFDLYSHMKINIKCSSPYCEIHESAFTDYCLACKRPVCEVCAGSFHSTHQLQCMSKISFISPEMTSALFRLESKVKSTMIFQNPEHCKKQIKEKIAKEFAEIENSLKELKDVKLEEVDSLFRNTTSTSCLIDSVLNTGRMLNDFISKHKPFLYDPEVKDEDNIIFLQVYDLFNDLNLALSDYEGIIDEIIGFFGSYETSDNSQYARLKQMICMIADEEKKLSSRASNIIAVGKDETANQEEDWGDNPRLKLINYFDRLKEDLFSPTKEKLKKSNEFIESFKRSVFESFKKHGSLVDIEKTVKIFDEKTNKRTNFIKGKANLKFSPSQAKAYSINGILVQSSNANAGTASDEEANQAQGQAESRAPKKKDSLKLNTLELKIKEKHSKKGSVKMDELDCLEEGEEEDSEEYEKKTQNLANQNQNLDENSDEDSEVIQLENGFGKPEQIKLCREMEKLKRMFLPKKKEKKLMKPKTESRHSIEDKDKFKINSKLQEMIKENQRLINLIKKPEDINLIVTIVRRYYSYVMLEFVRKNFVKQANKSVISSHLLIDKRMRDEDLNQRDNIKILEGTNEIQVYCREKRTLIKRALGLSKSVHGTNIFPNGCRTWISRDKLYVTGGKDLKNNDMKIFLVYSFKDDKIMRMPDMKKARSYHTIAFHENIKSILVFGGENNKSCEIYDIFVGAWTELPELNFARANINMYIDKIGTFAYAFCGSIGNISQAVHSDIIELLDLVDINQGWAKVDYKNKALVDLRFSHNGIYPLTEDKLLIYGAKESRKVHKTFVIFDLRTFDVLNVDDYYLEDLRKQASKNPELSKILTG